MGYHIITNTGEQDIGVVLEHTAIGEGYKVLPPREVLRGHFSCLILPEHGKVEFRVETPMGAG